MKKTLHDLLLNHQVVVPEKHDLQFEKNVKQFVAFSENRIKKITFDDMVMTQRKDGKMLIHSGAGQLLFAITLLCALTGRLFFLDEKIPTGASRTFYDMVTDDTKYKIQIEDFPDYFFRDFVINRVRRSSTYQLSAGKFWLHLYQLFANSLAEKEVDEIKSILEDLRRTKCRVYHIHLN